MPRKARLDYAWVELPCRSKWRVDCPKSEDLNSVIFDTVPKIPLTTGIVGWVASNGQPVWSPRPSEDRRFNPKISLDTNVPARSILCVPIMQKGRVTAVLEIIHLNST